jgi:2-oxoacid:acceptor oxidoreductase delta subunit (pyruvate/2-ketoisovalerate family)
MPDLKPWADLPVAGEVDPATTAQPRTGGWRTGLRPEVDLGSCVNCLLCWLYCPDSAVRLEGTDFAGFDLDFCKGCELCAEVCPTGAVRMVSDDE